MVTFLSIPTGLRTPTVAIEVDPRFAQQSIATKAYTLLVVAQKIAAGTIVADTPTTITSFGQARTLFGEGSQGAGMFEALFENNTFTTVKGVAMADPAGTAMVKTLTIAGTATESGAVVVYVAGRRISIAVASGDAASAIAGNIRTAIGNVTNLPIAITGAAADVIFTARGTGTYGNQIKVSVNLNEDEELPAGVSSATVADTTAGAGEPAWASALTAVEEEQYDLIGWGDSTDTSLALLEAHLVTKFGPLVQKDGVGFFGADRADVNTYQTQFDSKDSGAGRNDKHVSPVSLRGSETPEYEIAAAVVGVVGLQGAIDPARPFQTLQVAGIRAPALADQFNDGERNTLLNSGVGTLKVGPGNVVQIERLQTSYQVNSAGANDTAFTDVNVLLTLLFLRFNLRTLLAVKFPRHKLASDEAKIAPGQDIMTPSIMRAELVAWFDDMETLGLVEDRDTFKAGLVVEINPSDPNVLDIIVGPDFVNQLRVIRAAIQFRL